MKSFHKILVSGTIFMCMTSSHAWANTKENTSRNVTNSTIQIDNKLVIGQPDLEYSLFEIVSKRVLKKAYSRIGEDIQFELLPIDRSIDLANSGITDGELARAAGIQKKFTNLIQVPVPISSFDILVYSKYYNFKVAGWESLKPYKFDFVYGFKYAEQKSKGMNSSRIKTRYQGLSKLNEGRSDLFVAVLATQCAIHKYNFTEIKQLSPPLDTVVLYHFLHKRHEHIAKKLEIELLKMQKNGEIEKLQEQAKKELLKQCISD